MLQASRLDPPLSDHRVATPTQRPGASGGFGIPLAHLILTLLVGFALTEPEAAAQSSLAITGVTVIDATGAPPRPGVTVVIEDGLITAIGRDATIPGGARLVDGTDKFLIPGLKDMHVHIGDPEGAGEVLGRLLASGVTGVRDMASPMEILRLKADASEAESLAPTLFVAGPILQGPLPFQAPLIRALDGAAAARRAVDEVWSAGVDFVKVGDTLDRDSYLAVADQSGLRGLSFAGHLPVSIGAAEASDLGQRSIEHFGSARFHGVLIACSDDEDSLRRIAAEALETARTEGASPDSVLLRAGFIDRMLDGYSSTRARVLFAKFAANDTWQTPTLVAIRSVWNDQEPQLGEVDRIAMNRLFEQYRETLRAMRSAGVRILAGSDLPITREGSAVHDELVLLTEAGLSTLEALQTATVNPAEYLGRLDSEGTIEVGKLADLVMLNADPLTDIANTRDIYAVVSRGRLLGRRELAALR